MVAQTKASICSCKNLSNMLIIHGRNRSIVIVRKGDAREIGHGGKGGQDEVGLF